MYGLKLRLSILVMVLAPSFLSAQDHPIKRCNSGYPDCCDKRDLYGDSLTPLIVVCPPSATIEQWARQEGLVSCPDLLLADIARPAGREELRVPGQNLFVNAIQPVFVRWPEYDGRGTTISIKEYRFDSLDADIKGRYIRNSLAALTYTVHADLMATLCAGAGNSDLGARGVAAGAEVLSSSFLGLLPDPDADYVVFQIGVQNHSYGSDIENYYGAGARAYDQNTLEHPQLLHVFSAGNAGMDTSKTGAYAGVPGFANITGNYKMAKNVLVVGATDSLNLRVPFSSRGPAYDGRVKPDLVAYGATGSSGAAALVSGSAAVLRQVYFEKQGDMPPSHWLRAVLIASADDPEAPGPDFGFGFGQLNLTRAVELAENGWAPVSALQSSADSFELWMPAHVQRARVALVWNDLPAAVNAGKALLHDLDLEVWGPDGRLWLPWTLVAFPHADSLVLPARRGRDTVNTVEVVGLENPAAGNYRIIVKAPIEALSQSFSLAARIDTIGSFDWVFPVKGVQVHPGNLVTVQWQGSFLNNSDAALEWKYIGQTAWSAIASGLNPGSGRAVWTIPDTIAAAQVRLLADGMEYRTDTFLIAPELFVHVGFNCPDSLLLFWQSLGSGVRYRLWGLGNRYMQPLFDLGDTAVVLQKQDFPFERYAVSVLIEGTGAEGPRSAALDVHTQGVVCYFRVLRAYLNEKEQVELSLELGSVHGIQAVTLEKQLASGWAKLYTSQVPELLTAFTDSFPAPGLNQYRARLDMENGAVLYSEPATAYYPGSTGALLLPNPTIAGHTATLLVRLPEETPYFRMLDVLGRQLVEIPLEDARTEIPLPQSPGIYFWTVIGADRRVYRSGKLVVE